MKIDVLGESWKVVFKKSVKLDNIDVAGLCDYANKKILVATSYPEHLSDKQILFEISSTVYHEWLHAIFCEAGFENQSFWTPDVEHMIIAQIENSFGKNMPIDINIVRK